MSNTWQSGLKVEAGVAKIDSIIRKKPTPNEYQFALHRRTYRTIRPLSAGYFPIERKVMYTIR